MIAVIFEVWPKPEHRQTYLDIAASLRPQLERIDGFISIERFESLSEPGKILSLSFFRDDAAVAAWRNVEDHRHVAGIDEDADRHGHVLFYDEIVEDHRHAQAKGRGKVFADYRLRIAGVIRDYCMQDRAQAPKDSLSAHG